VGRGSLACPIDGPAEIRMPSAQKRAVSRSCANCLTGVTPSRVRRLPSQLVLEMTDVADPGVSKQREIQLT
jgi:hypothetical protein